MRGVSRAALRGRAQRVSLRRRREIPDDSMQGAAPPRSRQGVLPGRADRQPAEIPLLSRAPGGAHIADRAHKEDEREQGFEHGEPGGDAAVGEAPHQAFSEIEKHQQCRLFEGIASAVEHAEQRREQRQRFQHQPRAAGAQRRKPQFPGEAEKDQGDQARCGEPRERAGFHSARLAFAGTANAALLFMAWRTGMSCIGGRSGGRWHYKRRCNPSIGASMPQERRQLGHFILHVLKRFLQGEPA